jgi:hypothetical protein
MQQSGIVGCGGPGINMYTPGTAGVNCIGPKPDKSVVGKTILPFITLYNIQNSSVSSQPAWYQDDFSI